MEIFAYFTFFSGTLIRFSVTKYICSCGVGCRKSLSGHRGRNRGGGHRGTVPPPLELARAGGDTDGQVPPVNEATLLSLFIPISC